MANIWRNIVGRLGARSSSSMSRVADRASVPVPYKLTFFQGVCVTVGSCSAAVALLYYRIGLDRISAERRALTKGLERAHLVYIEELEREFLEWKETQLGAQIDPRETKMKAEQLAREFQEWKARRLGAQIVPRARKD